MHPARLFVLCGLPGSGTTTRAIELSERFAALRVSADDWMESLEIDIRDDIARQRIETIQGDLAMNLLRAGASVVVEGGTWMRFERDRLHERARSVGAIVHLELLDDHLDVLWERISRRAHEQAVGPRAIKRADLERWSQVIERPNADELARYTPIPFAHTEPRSTRISFPY